MIALIAMVTMLTELIQIKADCEGRFASLNPARETGCDPTHPDRYLSSGPAQKCLVQCQ